MDNLTSAQVKNECNSLKSYWRVRNEKFEDWYRMVTLDDSDLYQEDMEVVISNDPKTFFKRAVRFLASAINHTIPTDILKNADQVDTTSVINVLNGLWKQKDRQHRVAGKLPWMLEFVSFLLLTGWYDVLAFADNTDGAVAVTRNPAECFPSYDDEGLERHAHIYGIDYRTANTKCRRMGWNLPQSFSNRSGQRGLVIFYDYWVRDWEGVWNTVVIDSTLVKPVTKMKFDSIPILSGVTNGLPDKDIIVPNYDWQERAGESIIADIEDVQFNYNKHLSFVQQIIRDVAQPKWFEKSGTDTRIINSDTVYKRGAIFRMGVGEDAGPIQPPTLPIEVSLHTRELQGMIQRGSFPWTMYGGLTQGITSYTMSQISSAAKEILAPYADAIKFVIGEIDNIWIEQMRDKRIVVDGIYGIPDDFPTILKAQVDVAVEIPGDFIQRATLGRMISPDITFSQKTTMGMLWPEIKDVNREIAAARADRAMLHPVAIVINNISAWRYQAQRLLELGDIYGAGLFNKAADFLEAQLGQMTGGGEGQPSAPITPRQEVMPREMTSEAGLLI